MTLATSLLLVEEGSGEESSGDDDGSEYEEKTGSSPPSHVPHTRSRGDVSPLSVSGEAHYARSLEPSIEAEETEELSNQDASGSDK
ncbi:hypothetical protein V7S43_006262 [Phytophthora oleae]|uniref:Uncharacterized protein n=1 Tax=Phytophthora oleae TaxID=2107226 RepID=A0ABD3FVG8_9STRA